MSANPALGLSDIYKIINHLPPFNRTEWEKMPPCIRFLNDSQIMGLLPLFSRYATQMTENDISIRCAQINVRSQHIITAETGPEIESANAFMKGLEEGRLSAIMRKPFGDGMTITNVAQGQSNIVMQLIELQQYLKASWYNEIGLNSNFNMKSQYISSEEINSSADIMLPLIDNMFASRQSAVELINKHFGTNITVEKDSAWEKKQIQSDLGVQVDPVNGDILNASSVDSTDGDPDPAEEPISIESPREQSNDNPSPVDKTDEPDNPSPVDNTEEGPEPTPVIAITPDEDTIIKITVEQKDDDSEEEGDEENGERSDADPDVEPETE